MAAWDLLPRDMVQLIIGSVNTFEWRSMACVNKSLATICHPLVKALITSRRIDICKVKSILMCGGRYGEWEDLGTDGREWYHPLEDLCGVIRCYKDYSGLSIAGIVRRNGRFYDLMADHGQPLFCENGQHFRMGSMACVNKSLATICHSLVAALIIAPVVNIRGLIDVLGIEIPFGTSVGEFWVRYYHKCDIHPALSGMLWLYNNNKSDVVARLVRRNGRFYDNNRNVLRVLFTKN